MASKKDTLLPEDTDNKAMDVSDLRVNFSEEEAASTALSFDPVPSGKYNVAITEVEMRTSNSEKNKGKPYWAITMVVQDGPYEGRKFWGNVMLFEGALYSLSQLLKAVGQEEAIKTGKIPHGDSLVGEKITINVVKTRDSYKEKELDDGEKYFKNEVKGYKAFAEGNVTSSGGSLMP